VAVIQKEIELEGTSDKKIIALFDSGSAYYCIMPKLAQELELILSLPQPLEFETAKNIEKVTAKGYVRLLYLEDLGFQMNLWW